MKRWGYYSLIGFIFGFFDWFYLDWLSHGLGPNLGENPLIVIPTVIVMSYCIGLVPIIPVIIYEIKKSDKLKEPTLAAIRTWCCTLFSYYTYYAALLSLGKLPSFEGLRPFGERYPSFWDRYWRMFRRIILLQLLEWLPIAVIGGSIIAAFSGGYLINERRIPPRPKPSLNIVFFRFSEMRL